MSSSRGRRTTLARLMAVNAAAAVLFAGYRLGFSGLAESAHILAAASACLLVALVLNVLLDLLIGIRCPHCRRLALRRLALPFSWIGYHECTGCRTRCKRVSPFTPWRDASGPEDAETYRRKSSATRWLGYAWPEGDDSTCGTLLRSKRSRAASPAAPYPRARDEGRK